MIKRSSGCSSLNMTKMARQIRIINFSILAITCLLTKIKSLDASASSNSSTCIISIPKESTNFKNRVNNCSLNTHQLFAVKIHLTNLYESPFADTPKLKKLFLSENRLSKLDERAFLGLADLKKLDLSQNILSELSANTFFNLTSLQVLLLNGNRLVSIGARLFKYNGNLKKIKLSNNLLQTLTWSQSSSSANNLQLHNNNLKDISGLSNFPNLTSLKLSNNAGLQLNGSSFAGVLKLRNLSLDNANLLELNYNFSILATLKHLIFLNISNNQLEKLNLTQFPVMKCLEYFHFELNTGKKLNGCMKNFPKLKPHLAVIKGTLRKGAQHQSKPLMLILISVTVVCIVMVLLLVLPKIMKPKQRVDGIEVKIQSGVYFRAKSINPWEREDSWDGV